jgi:hypothetical protein
VYLFIANIGNIGMDMNGRSILELEQPGPADDFILEELKR